MNTQPIAKAHAQQTGKIKYLTITGLMAAMITLMTAYICHIPVGVNGGYIHFGDSLIYLAATLLPTPYALAAAAIGGGLADLLTAPMWTIATIIIKMLITIPFTYKSAKIITLRNIIATLIAYVISGSCYFFAEYILFGSFSSAFLASMSGSLIQSGGSAIFFIVFGLALDKAHIKKCLPVANP
ncbi:MAG: TIGR04002 family protein [Lachnospiraceae bacterium]|nr:TIGR04002 family protein [Lachnospiraceae bacterium]MBQ6996623.1 TIGR04002 family protein [Lachnospiraceae bacterium]